MKIFIDSADVDEIREAFSWGIVDGITTNPSLIKKAFQKVAASGEKTTLADHIRRILESAEGTPVSLEVIGTTAADMAREGKKLFELFNPVADNVVVKIPCNPVLEVGGETRYDGLKAISALAEEGIPVNTTLIFTPEQALLAAKAGAAYVSPFAGRIDDAIRKTAGLSFQKTDYFPETGLDDEKGATYHDNGIMSGVQLVQECVELFEGHNLPCEVLAASLRNPRQVRECALAGADVATIPFGVIRDMIDHPMTAKGMQAFCDDIVPEYRELLG